MPEDVLYASTLLPCLCCGGKAVVGLTLLGLVVRCVGCGLRSASGPAAEVAAAWNRRVPTESDVDRGLSRIRQRILFGRDRGFFARAKLRVAYDAGESRPWRLYDDNFVQHFDSPEAALARVDTWSELYADPVERSGKKQEEL